MLRNEQIEVLKNAVTAIQAEIDAGREMINRVLYISYGGTKHFENMP